ncbi:MAG: UDP-glucose dehydrogenase family protein [Armatimonadota bacterium]
MKVTIIGTGYVGLTTGVALAYTGHEVIAVDKDQTKLAMLLAGKSPIHELGIEQLMSQVKTHLKFTDDLASAIKGADLVLIAVGTPPKPNGEADLRFVEEVACEIGNALEAGQTCTIAIKSTVPIGTNRRVGHLVERILSDKDITANIRFASNPEFLREGVALQDTFYPDRIVVGSDQPEAVDVLSRVYRPILEQTFNPPGFLPRPDNCSFPHLVTTDLTSAEMTKYAANCFLALKISYINEIAGLCEKVGADVTEVARGIGLDARIGHRFLEAGMGWGGSCFPKDTAALVAVASDYGYTMPIISASREVNYRQRQYIVDKLQDSLKVLRGRVIGVLGLSFKPNTDDIRDSAAIEIIKILVERGAHIKAHDPVATDNARRELEGLDVVFVDDPYTAAANADALVLATEWDEYLSLDLNQLGKGMKRKILIDGRNLYAPEDAHEAGFIYAGIGR